MPGLAEALRALTPYLKLQVLFGLRISPLRVARLFYRVALLWGYARVARWFPRFRGRRPPNWLIRLLHHVAVTFETTNQLVSSTRAATRVHL